MHQTEGNLKKISVGHLSSIVIACAVVAGCGSSTKEFVIRIYDPATSNSSSITVSDVIVSQTQAYRTGRRANLRLQLTQKGQRKFSELTRRLARRGAKRHQLQHFVFEFDGRVYSKPVIDYRLFPNGLTNSTLVLANLDLKLARRIVTRIRSNE
jgi:preprotein translocase subunit SecD